MNTSINIMDQYYPAHRAFRYEEINRRLKPGEYKAVIDLAGQMGLINIL